MPRSVSRSASWSVLSSRSTYSASQESGTLIGAPLDCRSPELLEEAQVVLEVQA